ncbi:MAG TPA: FtsQ-type POTRA domain-containing protein, partial [Polyangiaceae bacterium]|nr:FtsQ-type POTRA domain-containing protein [Polyangiaceae bacterium]
MLQQALQLGRFSFWRLWFAPILALALGCGSEQLRERTVSDVEVLETSPSDVDLDEVRSGLATAAPRKFFWVERERDVYDANLLARDLERIERYYRAHGYYDVKVVAARVEQVAEREVEIEVHVTPGARVNVRSVTSDSAAVLELASDVRFRYQNVAKPRLGQPFTEELLDEYKTNLLSTLKEAGYPYASAKVTATVDLNAHAADIVTALKPGKRARFGQVRIVGLRQIPEDKVRAALDLKPGARYSEADQQDAQQALESMQLFTHVEVAPDLSNPDAEEVPIIVSVQEDQLRKLTLGGGTILDSLKFQMRVSTGWEHKNFLGGARKLSIEGKLGVDLFPMRLENTKSITDGPSNYFLVAESKVLLEQPSIFGGRTKGSVEAGFKREPLLYSLADDTDPKQEVVIGFNKPRAAVGLERAFFRERIVVAPSYNLEARLPFAYQKPESCSNDDTCMKGLETVWVSYPKLTSIFQTLPGDLQKLLPGQSRRDDKRDFTISFRNSIEIAGMKLGGTRVLGGSVSDVKLEPELRVFFPVWGSKRNREQKVGNLILASRFKVGFLFATDYNAPPASAPDNTDTNVSSDQQKLLSRAFYSGGALSNRGYAQNAIGPHGPIGFLLPSQVNCTLAKYRDTSACIRPLGGFTLWEASLELRFAGFYPLTLVGFVDASDVSRELGRLQFQYPHISVGPGLRYESPVGAIRLDIGVRVPGWQAIGQSQLPRDHGLERPVFFEQCDANGTCRGLPAAINLA